MIEDPAAPTVLLGAFVLWGLFIGIVGFFAGKAQGYEEARQLRLSVIADQWSGSAAACRECGCTEDLACEVLVDGQRRGCRWSEPDLCSACSGDETLVRRAPARIGEPAE